METMAEQVAEKLKPRLRRPRGSTPFPMLGVLTPPHVANAVKEEAARRGVSYSDVVREALADYVATLANGREDRAA